MSRPAGGGDGGHGGRRASPASPARPARPARGALSAEQYRQGVLVCLLLVVGIGFGMAFFGSCFGPRLPQGASVTSFRPAHNAVDVSPGSWIWLGFDRPVDRAAVEKLLRVSPPVKLTYRWFGGNRVAAIPSAPLAFDTVYAVTLAAQPGEKNGFPLRNNLSWRFRTMPEGMLAEDETLNPGASVWLANRAGESLVRLSVGGLGDGGAGGGVEDRLFRMPRPLTKRNTQLAEFYLLAQRRDAAESLRETLSEFGTRKWPPGDLVSHLDAVLAEQTRYAMSVSELRFPPEVGPVRDVLLSLAAARLDFIIGMRDFARGDDAGTVARRLKGKMPDTIWDSVAPALAGLKSPDQLPGVAEAFEEGAETVRKAADDALLHIMAGARVVPVRASGPQ